MQNAECKIKGMFLAEQVPQETTIYLKYCFNKNKELRKQFNFNSAFLILHSAFGTE